MSRLDRLWAYLLIRHRSREHVGSHCVCDLAYGLLAEWSNKIQTPDTQKHRDNMPKNYHQNNLATSDCSKVLQIKGTPWDISLY